MPIRIKVPYSEKDIAKSKGAFWDKEEKTWFIPDHKDIDCFIQWIDQDQISIIVKTPFYIALNTKTCYKCAEITPVIALAAEQFYFLDHEDNDDGDDIEEWAFSDDFSFFSMPSYLNNEIASLLKEKYPHYKLGYSRTAGDKYWANHCIHCGALQGDFYMHSEPGGEFCPVDIEDCQRLTLISVATKFDIEISAGTSWSSNSSDILHYAKRIDKKGTEKANNTSQAPPASLQNPSPNKKSSNWMTIILKSLFKGGK